MDKALIDRYQPGGDIYATLKAKYGDAGAAIVAIAAQSGDRAQVTDALARVKYGERLNESTLEIFLNQLATNPLDAPLDTLDDAVSKLFDSKGVWTLLLVGVAIVIAIAVVKD